MPVIHATFGMPLLATAAAVLTAIAITTAALLYTASAWERWIYGEHAQ